MLKLSELRPALNLPRLAVAIIGLFLVGWIAWKLFFAGDAAREKIATGIVAEERAEGQAKATETALEGVVIRYETHRTIDERVQEGVKNVYEAKDDDSADRAARSALCMSDAYRRANDCPGLPEADPSVTP